MATRDNPESYDSFLGTGWSFPPEFIRGGDYGEVRMSAEEEDIADSLKILFGTVRGERLFNPKYGLDLQELLFEPMSTTMRTLLKDRIKTAILVYEPRIILLSLELDVSQQFAGKLVIILDYAVRATNSRYNLVYPFYLTDSNELRASLPAQDI